MHKQAAKPWPVHYRSSANVEVSCQKGPPPLLQELAAAEPKTFESGQQERQQAVAMHGAFPRDQLSQPRSDRNWLKRRPKAKVDIPHVERTRRCRFADSAGAWQNIIYRVSHTTEMILVQYNLWLRCREGANRHQDIRMRYATPFPSLLVPLCAIPRAISPFIIRSSNG